MYSKPQGAYYPPPPHYYPPQPNPYTHYNSYHPYTPYNPYPPCQPYYPNPHGYPPSQQQCAYATPPYHHSPPPPHRKSEPPPYPPHMPMNYHNERGYHGEPNYGMGKNEEEVSEEMLRSKLEEMMKTLKQDMSDFKNKLRQEREQQVNTLKEKVKSSILEFEINLKQAKQAHWEPEKEEKEVNTFPTSYKESYDYDNDYPTHTPPTQEEGHNYAQSYEPCPPQTYPHNSYYQNTHCNNAQSYNSYIPPPQEEEYFQSTQEELYPSNTQYTTPNQGGVHMKIVEEPMEFDQETPVIEELQLQGGMEVANLKNDGEGEESEEEDVEIVWEDELPCKDTLGTTCGNILEPTCDSTCDHICIDAHRETCDDNMGDNCLNDLHDDEEIRVDEFLDLFNEKDACESVGDKSDVDELVEKPCDDICVDKRNESCIDSCLEMCDHFIDLIDGVLEVEDGISEDDLEICGKGEHESVKGDFNTNVLERDKMLSKDAHCKIFNEEKENYVEEERTRDENVEDNMEEDFDKSFDNKEKEGFESMILQDDQCKSFEDVVLVLCLKEFLNARHVRTYLEDKVDGVKGLAPIQTFLECSLESESSQGR